MAHAATHENAEADRLVSRQEAAEYLGLAEQTLRRWACRRQGPKYVKLGSAVRYRARDLRDWLDSNTIEIPTAEAVA